MPPCFWECKNRKGALSENDPISFSNPGAVRPASMHIKWQVDFDTKTVSGSVQYTLVRGSDIDSTAAVVIFDTQTLLIKAVKLVEDGSELKFTVGEAIESFGSPLEVRLPETNWKELVIVIEYKTTANSASLQWLDKEQTAGKQHPYFFTKCSAIQARSLIPCQDTPSVKIPYTAEITAPVALTVLMGAVRQDERTTTDGGYKCHRFVQKVPIPSYLIAMAIGKLEFKRIGPRTCVWAENAVLDAAAYEFEDTEKMLAIEEKMFGEYVWSVYDILVLPPSYPVGGMENPCLTFVTPALLAGDKSLVNVIAHEIAHSWTGNLVTIKTYEHFWLNEGLTMYLERKVLGNLHGEEFRQFLAIGGLKQMKQTIRSLGADNPMTSLVPNLVGVNPTTHLSCIPYEKGFLFLYYLEQIVGVDGLAKFLKHYIWENAYKSVDTNTFRDMFIGFFNDRGMTSKIDKIDWDDWFYGIGFPKFTPKYDHGLAKVATKLRTRWMTWDPESTPCPFSLSDLEVFTLPSEQLWEFLAQLDEQIEPLGKKKIKALDAAYNLSKVRNSEIKCLWITFSLKNQYKPVVPLALDFITESGRMKFLLPIYRALYASETTRPLAIERFKQNRPTMMPNSGNTIAKILNLTEIN